MRIKEGNFPDRYKLGQDSLYSTPPIDIRSNTEVQDEVTFTLSPNPTMGQSKLSASDFGFKGYFQIFTLQGIMLDMQPFTGEHIISTGEKNGIYYIRILDKNLKPIATQKLILVK